MSSKTSQVQEVKIKERVRPEDYGEEYKEVCFLAWFKNNRPSMRRLSPLLPLSDVGKRATEQTLRVWYKEDKWKERADRMDKSVAHEIEQVAIEEKVLMLKRHAKAAKLLVEKGMEFLEEFEIKKPADAIKAIKDGAELERLSRGGPLALDDFGKWTDGDLVKFITDQLQERRNTKILLTEGQDDSDDVIEGEISDESPDE